uniref:Uncharacterized protein n=1 Tax=Anguilla anguilla TaxID=7936 RepID=A0A0E9XDM7_ANGAN
MFSFYGISSFYSFFQTITLMSMLSSQNISLRT